MSKLSYIPECWSLGPGLESFIAPGHGKDLSVRKHMDETDSSKCS